MRMFRGFYIAALAMMSMVGVALARTAEVMVLGLNWLVGTAPPKQQLALNTVTPNLGLQRVGVQQFQRRRGESARRASYRRAAYNLFGGAALA